MLNQDLSWKAKIKMKSNLLSSRAVYVFVGVSVSSLIVLLITYAVYSFLS